MNHLVYHGDCLSGMKELADKSVDHIITDPPYSRHVHGNHRSGKRESFGGVKEIDFNAISQEVMTAAAQQFARIVRRWVLVFTDAEGVGDWIDALTGAGLEHIRVGAWIKRGATPQFTGDRPAAGYESIVIAHPKGRKRWNGGGGYAVWTTPIVKGGSGERTEHTTQKPQIIMEQLIREFTDAGDLICDPFAGSGTTLVAAKRLGRLAIGWESQEKYVQIANRRVQETKEQLSLLENGAA